jgi:dihydroorotate dehydrogenase electron transfer subunit
LKLKLVSQEIIAPGVYRMSLEYPAPNIPVTPGQFFMLKVSDELDPLLRRPLSVHEIDTSGPVPQLRFLYQVVGRGTTILSNLKPGDEVDLLGPLGRGFHIVPGTEEVVLVAGGIGVAPFKELVGMIGREYPDCRVVAFIGGKSAADVLDDLSRLGVGVNAVTEDGSLGERGLVTDVLEQYLSEPSGNKRLIFGCGPWGMMRRMAQLASLYDIPSQLSLDKVMACGVGACRGCVVQVKDSDALEGFSYKTVCKDGPVFDAGTLFLESSFT